MCCCGLLPELILGIHKCVESESLSDSDSTHHNSDSDSTHHDSDSDSDSSHQDSDSDSTKTNYK